MTKSEKKDESLGAEGKYEALVETAADAIFTLDLLGRFTFVNPAAERIAGYSEGELVGKHFKELLPAKYIPACLNMFQKALRGQPTPPIEIELVTKEGKRVLLELLGRPLKRGRRIVEIIGIGRDITERKRAEEALRESEEKYRDVVERANDGIVIIQETIIRYANPRLAEMWGGTVEEFIGTPFIDHVHPDELPKVVDRYKRRMAGEDVTPIYETVLRRKDDSKLYAELNAGIITYQGKSADLVIVRDIGERKRTEEALRKSEERYKKQFEEAMDAIFIADAETGILVDCNRAALELVGREKSELVGKHQRILHPPEEIEGELSRTFKQHLKEKEGQILETRVITKRGEVKDVAIKASIFELEGQKVLLGIFRDITERKRTEEEIQRNYDIQTTLNALLHISLLDISLEDQLERILDHILSIPWLALESRGGMFLVEDEPEVLVMKAQRGLATALQTTCAQVPFGRCLCGRAAVTQEIQFTDCLDGRHEIRYEGITPHGHYCVPILSAGRTLGVINLYLKEGHRRDQREEQFLTAVANTIAGITERKRAEEALRESEEKYRTILENIEDGYFEVDIAGNLTFFNDSLCRINGYSREEMMGMNNRQYMDDETAKAVYQTFNAVYRTGKPAKIFGYGIIQKDGTRRSVETSVSLISGSRGEPAGFRGIVRDITERKRAEEALRDEKALMDALMDNIPDSIYFKDRQCRLTRINRKMMRDLSLEEMSQALGKTDVDLFGEEFGRKTLVDDQRIMTTGEPIIGLIEGRQLGDGQINWTLTTKVPLRDASDQITGLVGITREINEIKQAEEEVQKRLREITALHKVSEVINATLDLKEVFQRVVEELSNAFGYRLVDIYLLEGESLRLQASVGYDAQTTIELIPLERGVLGRVARTGQPSFIRDVSQDPDYIGSHPDITREICIPVMSGGTTLGTLNVESDDKRPLTDHDLQLLSILSSHIGVAIENARLYDKTQRHLKEMTTLQKIGVDLTSSLDLSTLLQGIADSTLKLTNADYVHLFVLDPETGEFTQRAASWQPEAKKRPITWPRKNKGLTAAVFKAKEPVVIERAADHPLYSTPEARKWGVQSVAGFPLKGKWGLTGVLNVVFLQPHTFSKDELQLLALLADQAAIAIENARLYEKTQQLAITDGLTGLYNLRYFYETLEKEIQRSERYHRSISLVILDIDDLKAYNDLYGHLAGDDLLKELARLMSKVTRRADTSARYGGDEFAIILPETETEGARVLAQRLLEEVKEHRFSTQNGQTIGRITTSLGVATYPHHADSAKALVDAADKALLRAKGAGKNQLFVCAEDLTEVEPR